MTKKEKEEIKDLMKLLYRNDLSQFGKRNLETYINKLIAETEKVKQLQKENKVLKEENKKLDKIADKMYDYLSYYAWDDFYSNTGYNGEMFDYFYKEIDDE